MSLFADCHNKYNTGGIDSDQIDRLGKQQTTGQCVILSLLFRPQYQTVHVLLPGNIPNL